MASQGPLSPSSVVDDAGTGTVTWTNPGNATASDNVYAVTVNLNAAVSHYLKATGFGFTIPSGATVNGIVVEWEKASSTGTVSDNAIRIVKGGTIGATERSVGANWAAADQYDSYGGATDLWGDTWTDTDINASTFGAALSCKDPAGPPTGTPQVDHVRITVYYTTAAGAAVVTTDLFVPLIPERSY